MKKFVPTKENYVKLLGKKVMVRGRKVIVSAHETSSRGGSWERGFRFYESPMGNAGYCARAGVNGPWQRLGLMMPIRHSG